MTALQLVWNWRLVSRNRIATKDSLLWAAPQEKNPNILGKAWVGDIVGKLHAMDRKTARATLSVMRDALAQYGEQIGVEADPGAAGSLSSSPSRPEQEFSLGADTDPTTINFANTDFWTKRLDRSGTRDHTGLDSRLRRRLAASIKQIRISGMPLVRSKPQWAVRGAVVEKVSCHDACLQKQRRAPEGPAINSPRQKKGGSR